MAHRLSPDAENDLDEIWSYLAEQSGNVDVAQRVVRAITDRFYLLSAHPRMGRIRNDLRRGLRSHRVGIISSSIGLRI